MMTAILRMSRGSLLRLLVAAVTLAVLSDHIARADNPRDYLEISVGTLPIIITSPHGGGMIPSDVSARICDVDGEVCLNDQNTHLIAAAVGDELETLTGARPYQIINRIDRLYIDQNRSNSANPNGANESYEDGDARPYYEHYHGAINESIGRVLQDHGRGLLIDVHGQSAYPNTVIRGTRNGQTVTQLLELHGEAALTGPHSVFGRLEEIGYPVTPPNAPLSEEPETLYNGGHTVATYGSHRTLGIDSLQIEFGRSFRTTPSNPDIWQQSAKDLADAILVFLDYYLTDPAPPGDFNGDGIVDSIDYAVWRTSLNDVVEPLTGADVSGNGVVDQADYDIWRANYGSSSSATPGPTAAPEPSAIALAVLLSLVVASSPRAVR